MECLVENKLMKYNEDTLYEVRKLFDLHKPGAMKQAVGILEDWVKQQHHFTNKVFDKQYLEMTIIVSKGSLERAKARLDKACTLRTLLPHMCGVYDIGDYFSKGLIDIRHALLPKMTKDHERIYFLRNSGQHFEDNMLCQYMQASYMMAEYVRRNDYMATNIVIVDYTNINFTAFIQVLNIRELQEAAALMLECCGFRVKGLHIVTSSKMVEIVAKLFKQIVSAKLGDRFHIHKDFKPVTEMFGDILPEEYGGKERSLDDLHEDWVNELTSEDHTKYMLNISSAKTDESLRQKDKFNDQYLGMPGTFRTLSVD